MEPHPNGYQKMTDSFAPLRVLLNMLAPGSRPDELYAFAAPLNPESWGQLFAEARKQGVESYLYKQLSSLADEHRLEIPEREKLHRAYIITAAKNMIILHDAEAILRAFKNADIQTAGLKGIYLLEQVYADLGTRAMNDIDLLVHKQDLSECLEIMRGLGYQTSTYFDLADANIDTKHVPPMEKDNSTMVELHWTLLEEDEPFTLEPEGIWARTMPANIANVDAHALGIEDLILHLSLHLTYQHFLKLGLRGLLDIALVIHKFQGSIDWQKMVSIAKSWGAERVTALTLKLVESGFRVPIHPGIIASLVPEGIAPWLVENAHLQLLQRAISEDRFTPDLADFSLQKSLFSKIRIGFRRVFIPRISLARIYSVPPNSPRILGLYLVRLRDLYRTYGKTLRRLKRKDARMEPALEEAAIANVLHAWMVPPKK